MYVGHNSNADRHSFWWRIYGSYRITRKCNGNTIRPLGAGDKLVGPDEVRSVPGVGSGFFSRLRNDYMPLKPDVLFAWSHSREAIYSLETKMAVIYINPNLLTKFWIRS